jgi:hypothetical protein
LPEEINCPMNSPVDIKKNQQRIVKNAVSKPVQTRGRSASFHVEKIGKKKFTEDKLNKDLPDDEDEN